MLLVGIRLGAIPGAWIGMLVVVLIVSAGVANGHSWRARTKLWRSSNLSAGACADEGLRREWGTGHR